MVLSQLMNWTISTLASDPSSIRSNISSVLMRWYTSATQESYPIMMVQWKRASLQYAVVPHYDVTVKMDLYRRTPLRWYCGNWPLQSYPITMVLWKWTSTVVPHYDGTVKMDLCSHTPLWWYCKNRPLQSYSIMMVLWKRTCATHQAYPIMFLWKWTYAIILQWGTADTEIKVPSVENPEMTNILPLKPWVSQNIASHASPTASVWQRILLPKSTCSFTCLQTVK